MTPRRWVLTLLALFAVGCVLLFVPTAAVYQVMAAHGYDFTEASLRLVVCYAGIRIACFWWSMAYGWLDEADKAAVAARRVLRIVDAGTLAVRIVSGQAHRWPPGPGLWLATASAYAGTMAICSSAMGPDGLELRAYGGTAFSPRGKVLYFGPLDESEADQLTLLLSSSSSDQRDLLNRPEVREAIESARARMQAASEAN